MEFTELLEQIQIEGAGQGDVVFIVTAPDMQSDAFVKFASALRSHVDRDRADGKYFPRCIVMPPGVAVEVARAQSQDRVEIAGGASFIGQTLAASPDDGSPHG
ncbi:hypothetical protein [Paraburkholderia dipogonis]|uniref:hypothetical protein n=1 Tax=Paraburkholderia dipogonis TaxID=1211383 RepID=UPI0038B91062